MSKRGVYSPAHGPDMSTGISNIGASFTRAGLIMLVRAAVLWTLTIRVNGELLSSGEMGRPSLPVNEDSGPSFDSVATTRAVRVGRRLASPACPSESDLEQPANLDTLLAARASAEKDMLACW